MGPVSLFMLGFVGHFLSDDYVLLFSRQISALSFLDCCFSKSRINFIKSRLQEFRNNPRFSDYDIQIQIKDLNNGLEDSLKDFHNYLWIALNYEEYEALSSQDY